MLKVTTLFLSSIVLITSFNSYKARKKVKQTSFDPTCSVMPVYVFGSPLLDKATLKLLKGKSLDIVTKNNGKRSYYVKT